MNLPEKINFIVTSIMLFSVLFNMFMFYYISRKHMKVLDKIVCHREFTDDNYILATMRIGQYLVLIFVSRIRKQLPEDAQKKIIALNSKFRRPFVLLFLNFILFLITVLFTKILKQFYGV